VSESLTDLIPVKSRGDLPEKPIASNIKLKDSIEGKLRILNPDNIHLPQPDFSKRKSRNVAP